MFQQGFHGLVALVALRDGQILTTALLHQFGEPAFENINPFNHAGNILRVEGQGLFQVLKDADEIQDEPSRFGPSIGIFVGRFTRAMACNST